jgi:TIR domain
VSESGLTETGAPVGDPIRVFLNYRREDTGGHALHLYSDLVERFGDDSVFMDMRALEPGLDFADAIEAALGVCDVVLCLVGPRWVTLVNDAGVRRLDDPHDWVRQELEAALARSGVRVIPVLVERAQMPEPHELPEKVAGLGRRQAFELSNMHWTNDVERLVAVLGRVAQQKSARLAEEEAERARQAEQARLAQEVEVRDRAREESERAQQAHDRAEQERLAHAEAERVASQEAERQRLAREQAEREEAAREAERLHAEEEARRRAREAAGIPPPPMQPQPVVPADPFGRGGGPRRLSTRTKVLAGAAIAVVVLVAAVAAAVGLRDDDTTASSTTTTEPTTTGEGGPGPFPSAAESRLLTFVPRPIRRTCDRTEALVEVAAAVFCTPSKPDVGVSYYQFKNRQELNSWYAFELEFYEVARGSGGDCFTGELVGEASYTVDDATAGRVLCTFQEDGDAVRSWTDTRLNIGSSAFRLDSNAQALFRAWRDDLGPDR